MKHLFCALILLLALAVCGTSSAAENPGDKFSRGVVNVISAPVEIAKQIDQEWKKNEGKKAAKGIFIGFFKGITYTIGRMGSGLWDIVSCPFQLPKDYEPLVKPDYVLEQDQLNAEQAP